MRKDIFIQFLNGKKIILQQNVNLKHMRISYKKEVLK